MDEYAQEQCALSDEEAREGWEMKYGSGYAADQKACPRDAAGSANTHPQKGSSNAH